MIAFSAGAWQEGEGVGKAQGTLQLWCMMRLANVAIMAHCSAPPWLSLSGERRASAHGVWRLACSTVN